VSTKKGADSVGEAHFASCPPEERADLSLTNSGSSRTVAYGRAVPIGELVVRKWGHTHAARPQLR
jgi:hypothetical protein